MTNAALLWIETFELSQRHVFADPISRSTLLMSKWSDEEAVARYLNPSGYLLEVQEAKTQCDFYAARIFVDAIASGDIPDWCLWVVDYDLIEMAAK